MNNTQLSIFPDEIEETPTECCYRCKHFNEFKEPREVSERGGSYIVFGMCSKGLGKNGSYTLYPIYVPGGKCRDFKRKTHKKE
jgi:hypothetical protein